MAMRALTLPRQRLRAQVTSPGGFLVQTQPRTMPASTRRRAAALLPRGMPALGSEYPGAVHADGLDRAARPVGLPQHRPSPWWRGFFTRSRLDRTPLESGSRLCRKQASRCCARLFPGAALAGGPQQRGRSRLGSHTERDSAHRAGLQSAQSPQPWSPAVTGIT